MKFNKLFLVLVMLFSLSLSAQNLTLAFNVTNTFSDDHNFRMNVTASLPASVQNGFFIQLPAGVQATPRSVLSAKKALWLKEDATLPAQRGVVHWSRQNSGILFLAAPGTLLSGDVQLQFQSYIHGKVAATAGIALTEIRRQADQSFSAGPVLGRKQLFQIKNNEIR